MNSLAEDLLETQGPQRSCICEGLEEYSRSKAWEAVEDITFGPPAHKED